jgi:hypothetical protein
LKENYGEITVSLHWSEYSNSEVINAYKSLGHDPITYGVGSPWLKGYSESFLDNQISQLEKHGKIVTNAMQTSVLYALSLGLDVEFGGPASWKKKVDEFGTYGDYGQEYWKNAILTKPEQTWKVELGFNELLSPEQLISTLEWDTNRGIRLTFISSRFLDILRDQTINEKISYLNRG